MNRRLIATLTTSIAVALLAGCGGPQPPIGAPGATNDGEQLLKHHQTFHFTGSVQRFKVPGRVTEIQVVAKGAAGAGVTSAENFGRGGRVYAVIPVHPKEALYVFVGGQGSKTGGFNGGGNPGKTLHFVYGYGGGGASDVREGGRALSYRIVVAAGGGGQGCCYYPTGAGGNGGPDIGEAGAGISYGAKGGGGGTQTEGGAGGPGKQSSQDGLAGESGIGGRGGKTARFGRCNSSNYRCVGGGGGGGGGGYYGGGGGGGGINDYSGGVPGAGGGGGSSYVEASAIKVRLWRGWKKANGDGLVVLSWQ